MKGLETMPLKYMIIGLIIMVVVGVGLWQINSFMTFKIDKDFKEDITDLAQKMDYLHGSGDYGAVMTGQIFVPGNFEFWVDIDDSLIVGNLSGEIFQADMRVKNINITKIKNETGDVIENGRVAFYPGNEYSISLYYGQLEPNQVKDLTIVFEPLKTD